MKTVNHSNRAIENANWASQLIELIDVSQNLDLRLLHYFALTKPDHVKPNGITYANTTEDLSFLCNACDNAARLRLVPYHIFANNSLSYPNNILSPRCGDMRIHWPKTFKDMFDSFCRRYVRAMVSKTQSVHVEVWLEDSQSVSIIEPIADKYNVNLIACAEPISIATIFHFVRRIVTATVPVRILHLSDYDPDCVVRHKITARKIEMMINQLIGHGKVDVKVRHLMLTPGQCAEHDLPSMPAGRKIELLAMQAVNPNSVTQELEEELARYIDLKAIGKASKAIESTINQMLPAFNKIIDSKQGMTDIGL